MARKLIINGGAIRPTGLLLFCDLGGYRSPAVACWASDHWVASSNPLRGVRRSPAVACWASDHWVASSNPLRVKFHH